MLMVPCTEYFTYGLWCLIECTVKALYCAVDVSFIGGPMKGSFTLVEGVEAVHVSSITNVNYNIRLEVFDELIEEVKATKVFRGLSVAIWDY